MIWSRFTSLAASARLRTYFGSFPTLSAGCQSHPPSLAERLAEKFWFHVEFSVKSIGFFKTFQMKAFPNCRCFVMSKPVHYQDFDPTKRLSASSAKTKEWSICIHRLDDIFSFQNWMKTGCCFELWSDPTDCLKVTLRCWPHLAPSFAVGPASSHGCVLHELFAWSAKLAKLGQRMFHIFHMSFIP